MEWKGHGRVGDAVERPWLGRRRGRGHDRLEWCRGILERRRRSVGSRECVCEIGEMETERERKVGMGSTDLGWGLCGSRDAQAGRSTARPSLSLPMRAKSLQHAISMSRGRRRPQATGMGREGERVSSTGAGGARNLNHRIFYSREASGRLWSPQLDSL